jgi:uncharacterized protein
MKCPVDDTELAMTERQGIEVDYCPKCRGVWLDRGELDKIIERSADDDAPQAAAQPVYRDEARYREEPRYRDDGDRRYGSHRSYKKKKSLLGEIFDF